LQNKASGNSWQGKGRSVPVLPGDLGSAIRLPSCAFYSGGSAVKQKGLPAVPFLILFGAWLSNVKRWFLACCFFFSLFLP
jgi:hypothetical protein